MKNKILILIFFSLKLQIFSQEYSYFDGNEEKKIYLQKDYLVDFSKTSTITKNIDPKANFIKQIGIAKIYKISNPNVKNQIQKGILTKNLKNKDKVSEVFTSSPGGGPKIAFPGNIIIAFKENISKNDIENFLNKRQLNVVRTQTILNKEYYIIESPAGLASLELANQLRTLPEVEYSKPDMWIEISKR